VSACAFYAEKKTHFETVPMSADKIDMGDARG
jgi:hypothetical protein